MNILYIGQYRGPNNDGWSVASKKYLEALLLTDHNVAAKPIFMAYGHGDISSKIQAAENNLLDKVDVIIQHTLPDFFERHDCYNIGLFFTETRHIQKTGWIEKINLMDEVWVTSPDEAESLLTDGVKCKINVVSIPFKEPSNIEPFKLQEIEDKYVFYFVGEHTERKNIMALVKAFHLEFNPDEPVSLVIKTNAQELSNEINDWRVKSRLKSEYIPEIIVHGNLSDAQIAGIHDACNCLVVTSRGECCCMPILDALYFKNQVICTNRLFTVSLFNPQNELPLLWTVNSREEPVETSQPPLPHIYTANETWMDIDILDLCNKMRMVYNNRNITERDTYREFVVNNFSIKAISDKITQCLSSVTLSENQ